MSSFHSAERERALRYLADVCAKDVQAFALPPNATRLQLSVSCPDAFTARGFSSEASDHSSSDGLTSSSSAVPSSPSSLLGSPVIPMRAPLIRPTEIKRRNRKRQVPGETQTDLRRLAKRARARQSAQQRLQAILGAAMYCHACGTTETPEWRRGPDGQKSLCNACGLHFAKIVRTERERQEAEAAAAASVKPQITRMAVTALLN